MKEAIDDKLSPEREPIPINSGSRYGPSLLEGFLYLWDQAQSQEIK